MKEEFVLKNTTERKEPFRLGFVGSDNAGCQFVQKCREAIMEQHQRLVDFDEFSNRQISSEPAKDCFCIVAAIGTETTAEQLSAIFSASSSCDWKILVVPQKAWTASKSDAWHKVADTVLVVDSVDVGAVNFCTVLSTAFLPGLIGIDYEDCRTTLSDATATGYLLHAEAAHLDAAVESRVKQPEAVKFKQARRAAFAVRCGMDMAMLDVSKAIKILEDTLPDTANAILGAVPLKGMEKQESIHGIIMT